MPGKQAKAISPRVLRRMLAFASATSTPERDRVVVLLSVRAGLRACEIAGVTWSMVLDDRGAVGDVLHVRDAIAKKRHGRRVPIHPDLRAALVKLHRSESPDGPGAVADGRKRTSASLPPERPVVRSARGGAMAANSIVNWFVTLFRALEVEGCSSHSGRRTFITNAARRAHKAGASLRDVQMLAGHRSIETTQGYIDGDTTAQRKLVGLL